MHVYTDIRKNEKLCKCPVCGSEVVILDYFNTENLSPIGTGMIMCLKQDGEIFQYGDKFGKKKKAIAAWNEWATQYQKGA